MEGRRGRLESFKPSAFGQGNFFDTLASIKGGQWEDEDGPS